MASSEAAEIYDLKKGAVVKEGFLCPMCMDDLRSFHNLQRHFELKHYNEDKAFMDQVKGMFSRAKDKLFNKEYMEKEEKYSLTPLHLQVKSSHELDIAFWDPQGLGIIKHHIDQFRSIRDARIDRTVVETNKIIIRLDKLLQMSETDLSQRKEYERSLVPWVQDEDVPFCPTCGDKFTITRRRHHCRLCGAIMCAKCSIFLSVRQAEEMIKRNEEISHPSKLARGNRQLICSLPEEEIEKIYIRVCVECNGILLRNQDKLNPDYSSSLLVKLHTKMIKAMNAAEKLCPEYQAMAQSLSIGEEVYKLDVVVEKRLRLMQMFEAVDVLSKKIAVLCMEDEENSQSPGDQRLQNSIRAAACSYLQNNMLSLPSLPSAPKLIILQARTRGENEKRLSEQREEAQKLREEQRKKQDLERQLVTEQELADRTEFIPEQLPFSYSQLRSDMVGNPGWSADTSRSSRNSDGLDTHGSLNKSSDDVLCPLLEQISYVEESLKQAKSSSMKSETNILLKNLEELKLEYKKQNVARAFARAFSFGESSSSQLLEENSQSRSSPIGDENMMLHQINYIYKCIENAKAAEKFDEVDILTENLKEIEHIYSKLKKT